MRLICKSRTYQLSVETNKWNADDKVNYSHAMARRLPAEVLLDAVYRVTGSVSKIPGVPPGTRAAALPDSGVELPSGFLTTFGRPGPRERLRVRAVERHAARAGHGPGQRPDPGRRHRRPVQRADQAGRHAGRRLEADRRAVREDPQPPADRGGGRDLPQGHAGRRGGPPPAWPRSSAAARSSSPSSGPQLERQRQAAIATAQAALAAYEKELAPRARRGRSARRPRRPPSSRPTSRTTRRPASPRRWPTGRRTTPRRSSIDGPVLEPKTMSATNRSVLTKEPDGSIVVSGPNKNGVVTIVGRDRADRDHRAAARGPAPTAGCPTRAPGVRPTATSCSTSSS